MEIAMSKESMEEEGSFELAQLRTVYFNKDRETPNVGELNRLYFLRTYERKRAPNKKPAVGVDAFFKEDLFPHTTPDIDKPEEREELRNELKHRLPTCQEAKVLGKWGRAQCVCCASGLTMVGNSPAIILATST